MAQDLPLQTGFPEGHNRFVYDCLCYSPIESREIIKTRIIYINPNRKVQKKSVCLPHMFYEDLFVLEKSKN
jgi:hypothetical protein